MKKRIIIVIIAFVICFTCLIISMYTKSINIKTYCAFGIIGSVIGGLLTLVS